MSAIINNTLKYLKYKPTSSKKSLFTTRLQAYRYKDFVQRFYASGVIVIALLLSYWLVSTKLLSADAKTFLGFSTFYIPVFTPLASFALNVIIALILSVSAILGKGEARCEELARLTAIKMRRIIIPLNHYLCLFCIVFFPAFIIFYCSTYKGVNWSPVLWLCFMSGLTIIESMTFCMFSLFVLDAAYEKTIHYNSHYNLVKIERNRNNKIKYYYLRCLDLFKIYFRRV